jgi:hypothetical protein
LTKSTNPTAAEFAAMLAEVKVAERACSDARGSKEEESAGQRVIAASNAILAARPTDPGVMAAQLRFLVADSTVDADTRICDALEHIADQLKALAGGVVLSAETAAQIRAALLAVLEHSGGGIEPEDDPDLSPGIGLYAQDSEHQLRAAYRLLDLPARRAAPRQSEPDRAECFEQRTQDQPRTGEALRALRRTAERAPTALPEPKGVAAGREALKRLEAEATEQPKRSRKRPEPAP